MRLRKPSKTRLGLVSLDVKKKKDPLAKISSSPPIFPASAAPRSGFLFTRAFSRFDRRAATREKSKKGTTRRREREISFLFSITRSRGGTKKKTCLQASGRPLLRVRLCFIGRREGFKNVSAGVGEGLGQRERSQGEGGCFNRESRFLFARFALFLLSLSLSLLLDVRRRRKERFAVVNLPLKLPHCPHRARRRQARGLPRRPRRGPRQRLFV